MARPQQVADVLLFESFSSPYLPRLRMNCYELALGRGLSRERALMFAFAVNEAMLNAVEHGGGRGVLVLLHDKAGRLVAEVIDHGHGIASPVPVPESLPSARAPRGRGLWMSLRLVDQLLVRTGEQGTTLRLVMATGGRDYRWAGSRHDARLAAQLAAILFPADPTVENHSGPGDRKLRRLVARRYRVSDPAASMAARPASRRAMGTRNGEHET